MEISAPTSPAPQNFGSLRELGRGTPDHAAFAVARTVPTDDSTPMELSTKGGTRLWQSFDEDVARVLSDAQQAAKAAGQAVAIVTAQPGHWQQFFVMPLFRTEAGGAQQAVAGLAELGIDAASPLAHSGHLIGLADATTSIDVQTMPLDGDLMPPRARPGAF